MFEEAYIIKYFFLFILPLLTKNILILDYNLAIVNKYIFNFLVVARLEDPGHSDDRGTPNFMPSEQVCCLKILSIYKTL